MKRSKGFTLIELLAVILILGIIAVIAVPTISKILEESRSGAFKSTVQNLIDAIETSCNKNELLNREIKSYTFTNGKVDNDLEVKGKLPDSGYSDVDSECNVSISVTNGKYKAEKNFTDDEIKITKCNNNDCIYNTNLVSTDKLRSCYDFDESTKTITKYHREDSKCPTNIVIPDKIDNTDVEHIRDYAFYYLGGYSCNNGKWYVSPTYVEGQMCSIIPKWDNDYNLITPITSLSLPKNLISIGKSAFQYNKINNIKFNSKLKNIGDKAFDNNTLENIYLPDNIFTCGNDCFSNNNISTIRFSENMTEISDGFIKINPITNITIPGNIKVIGGHSFLGTKLKYLNIEEGVEDIKDMAFYDLPIETLILPKSLRNIGTAIFNGANVINGNKFIYSISNGIENKKILINYVGAEKNVSIPNIVEEIGIGAFANCNIESVVFPNQLKIIGSQAFIDNNLKVIDIPLSVTTIEKGAFWKWKNTNSNMNLTKIINRTGKSFNWSNVIDDQNANPNQNFETGTYTSKMGNISITKE